MAPSAENHEDFLWFCDVEVKHMGHMAFHAKIIDSVIVNEPAGRVEARVGALRTRAVREAQGPGRRLSGSAKAARDYERRRSSSRLRIRASSVG